MKLQKNIFVDTFALPVASEEIYGKLFPIFKTRVEERSGASVSEGKSSCECCGFNITLKLDAAMADEAFDISDGEGGVIIKGKNFNSLMYGIGQLLHKSRYDENGMYITDWRGYSAPECSFRSIYFAIHFYNWYHTTTPEELARYFEDLMLWGYNGACGTFAKLNLDNWDDPNVEKSFALIEKLLSTAKSLNLMTTILLGNTDFRKRNMAVASDMSGIHCKTGQSICTSKEEGYQYSLSICSKIVERLAKIGIDYYIYFPYDEGGCSCEMCAPWGGNGYYRYAKRLNHDLKKYSPNTKSILCTWHFHKGINDKRDFKWLDRAIREDKALGDDWVSYIMLETRNGMPDFVKEHGVPGGCEAIDFPEITMQNLEPWGGYGAVCTPTEIKRVWDEVGGIMQGGNPYSEGKYDDLNKAISAGLFWEKNRSAEEIFKDYCGYEFKEEIFDELWEMSVLMERNQYRTHTTRKEPADMNEVKRIRELAVKIDSELPESIKTKWQWRIFYIRGLLDYERYSALEAAGWNFDELIPQTRFRFWGQLLRGDRLAQKLQRELLDIYDAPKPYDAQKHFGHHMVRPQYIAIIENFESRWEKNNR